MTNSEELIIPAKLRSGEFDRNKYIAQFRKSEYGKLLLECFAGLDTGVLYISDFHGSDHVERVMMNGGLLCFRQGLSLRDSELILTACMYHDIGRHNDHGDPEHGPEAARMLSGGYAPLLEGFDDTERCCILTAISTHSQPDETLDKYLELYRLTGRDAEKARLVTFNLKDADNLDRFRVGDFDPSHLRSDAARALVDTSLWVFDNFGRKPFIWWK